MAINKRKILDSAQKHLQKGALEKALKDYETLLKADPKDANFRLKIGDIQLKRGKPDEAIAAYVKVAESFMKNGFDAKAVALYKQITKIDEKRVDVFVPLAELYERMGLQSDALKVLQQAADVHYREGNKDEALDLLRRMAALDPSNTTNRIKVADLLRQGGRNDEAVTEYEAVAEELGRQGAEEDRIRILARILEIDPERLDLMASVGRSRLDTGNYEAAEKTARMMIARSAEDPDGWLLLGEACNGLGRDDEKVDAYRRAAEIFRERGEDDRARDLTQRFVVPAELETSTPMPELEDDLLGSSVDDLGGQDPEESDPGFDPNSMSIGSPIDDLAEEPAPQPVVTDAPLPPLPRASAAAAPEAAAASEGDPEQLLAEASVYLRYGKHDRAIESLRAIVALDPSHGLACMKLGDALKAVDQGDEAIGAYEQAAHAARASGDMAIFDVASEALAALAPERAAALENGPASEPEVAPAPAPEPVAAAPEAAALEAAEPGLDEPAAAPDLSHDPEQDLAPELDLELEASIDVEFDDGLDEPADDTATPIPERVEPDIELDEIEVDEEGAELEVAVDAGLDELELDDEIEELEPTPTPEAAVVPPTLMADAVPSLEEPTLEDPGLDVEIDIGLDLAEPDDDSDELDISDPGLEMPRVESVEAELAPLDDELEAPGPLSEPQIESPSAASMTTPAQVAEDLEEADFFFQQGMLDEARAVYERILAAAPSHPQVLLRIGEIEAATPPAEADTPEEMAVDVASDAPVDEIGDGLYEDGDAASFGLLPDEEADPDDEPTGRLAPEAIPEPPEIEFGSEEDESEGSEDLGVDMEASIEPAADESWEAPADEELGGLEIDLGADDDAHALEDDAEALEDDAEALAADAADGLPDGADSAAVEEGADVLVAETASPVADEVVLTPASETAEIPASEAAEIADEVDAEALADALSESDVATLAPLAEDDVEAGEAEAPHSSTPVAEADITAPVVEVVPPVAADDAEALPDDEQDPTEESTAPVGDAVEEPMPVVAAAADDDAFDLAAQLSDVFDLEEPTSGPISAAGGTEDEGFEQVFAAFKQGVEGALDESDFEAHYDLGIAYREMGLVEDAISEFTAAMGSPDRKLACLHMMGLCALDLQRTADAVAHLEQALALPDMPSDQQMAIRFDLGRAYAADGDAVRARSAFEAVHEQDPAFQDVGDQLAGLDALAPEELPVAADEEADEAFENFDDLMSGEAEADAEELAAEPEYESFDEFMSDEDSALAEDESDGDGDDEPVDAAVLEPASDLGNEESDAEAAVVKAGDESEAPPAAADDEAPLEDAEPVAGDPMDAEPTDAEPTDLAAGESDEAAATPADPESDDEPPKRGRREKKISFV